MTDLIKVTKSLIFNRLYFLRQGFSILVINLIEVELFWIPAYFDAVWFDGLSCCLGSVAIHHKWFPSLPFRKQAKINLHRSEDKFLRML
jgi:hypothetical protein